MAPRKRPARALRENRTLSLAPATIRVLDAIAETYDIARARVVDAAVTHANPCACDACAALAAWHDKELRS